MTAIEQPADTTHYVSCCPECHCTRTFTSERSRELWDMFHTHDQSQSC